MRVQGVECRVKGLGIRVQSLGVRIGGYGRGFHFGNFHGKERIWGLGCSRESRRGSWARTTSRIQGHHGVVISQCFEEVTRQSQADRRQASCRQAIHQEGSPKGCGGYAVDANLDEAVARGPRLGFDAMAGQSHASHLRQSHASRRQASHKQASRKACGGYAAHANLDEAVVRGTRLGFKSVTGQS